MIFYHLNSLSLPGDKQLRDVSESSRTQENTFGKSLDGLILQERLDSLSQKIKPRISSVQFSSVALLCPTLCNPMNLSTPGLPVHQQLPKFTQTRVH